MQWWKKKLIITTTVVAAVLLSACFWVGMRLGGAGQKNQPVPSRLAEQLLFPLYTITPPNNYLVDAASYHIEQGVLLFRVTGDTGGVIQVTEQAIPPNFDFVAFYQQELHSTKNLRHTTFPSVLGKTDRQELFLSITTPKTWLIVHSTTASEDDLRFMAAHIARQ